MNSKSKLGKFSSVGRLIPEPLSKYRTPFQRDRDRIIHSASFRRLKHKTQVFVNTEGDHYRTRITHSIEVAQIARSISSYLGLNDDLSETLSLAHDLGHTPFGHAGEDALNDCMSSYGGFDHNLQTLRIVMFLENKYLKFKGLNLTIETLEGLLKHNGPVEDLDLVDTLIGKNRFKNKINFKTYPPLEAQIAAISDDIAYNNHDIQDGIKANLFKLEELVEIGFFKDIYNKYKKKLIKKITK
jgi:dGTPase